MCPVSLWASRLHRDGSGSMFHQGLTPAPRHTSQPLPSSVILPLTFFRTMFSLCLEMGESGEMSYLIALYCWIWRKENIIRYIECQEHDITEGGNSPSCIASWTDRPQSSRPWQRAADRPATREGFVLWIFKKITFHQLNNIKETNEIFKSVI